MSDERESKRRKRRHCDVEGCRCRVCTYALYVEAYSQHCSLEYWRSYFDYEKHLLDYKEKQRRTAPSRPRGISINFGEDLFRAFRDNDAPPNNLFERRNEEKEREEAKDEVKSEEVDITDVVEVETNIHTLDDLIDFAENIDMRMRYSFDKHKLKRILPALHKLRGVVGMEKVKTDVAQQVLYFLQSKLTSMNHTVIMGSSGTGKTTLAHILGDIYHGLELITTPPKKPCINHLTGEPSEYPIVVGKRTNMIAEYVGQTAVRTQKVINEAMGGILIIDEVYELGLSDSYSQECIDTLNRNLSEKKTDFVCIIIGYEKEIFENIFGKNSGMERRFPYRYVMEPYNGAQLSAIFCGMLEKSGAECKMEREVVDSFFEEKHKEFKHFGGDMEILCNHCLKSNARRCFGKIYLKPSIEETDLKVAFELFMNNKKNDRDNDKYISMYV